METRGDARHSSGGRQSSFGRRLRVGAAGTIVVGGAIFLGGAAGLVTAFANTGHVTGSQSCTSWSASVTLNGDVTSDKNIDVVSTLKDANGTLVGPPTFSDASYDTKTSGMPKTIWTASGTTPVSGTLSLEIDLQDDVTPEHSPSEAGYSVTLTAPTSCTAGIATQQSAGGVVGTVLSDTATVTGTAGSPSGSVTFELFPPSNATCSTDGTAPAFTSAAINLTSVSPGVSNAASGPYTSAAVGTYHWVAAYSGSSTYSPAKSDCSAEAVTTTAGGGGVKGITTTVPTPSTGGTGSLTGITLGGFLLLGGLGVALMGAIVPRRRRTQ